MERHDIILAEISVEFLGHEIRGACFVGLHAVDDKIEIIGKRFDLGLVSSLDRILDSKMVELEDVGQDINRLFHLVRSFTQKIDPNDVRLVRQELRQLLGGEPGFNFFTTAPIDENFHIVEYFASFRPISKQ